MCYSLFGMVHIIELLLLIWKRSPCSGGRGFPLPLSEISFLPASPLVTTAIDLPLPNPFPIYWCLWDKQLVSLLRTPTPTPTPITITDKLCLLSLPTHSVTDADKKYPWSSPLHLIPPPYRYWWDKMASNRCGVNVCSRNTGRKRSW